MFDIVKELKLCEDIHRFNLNIRFLIIEKTYREKDLIKTNNEFSEKINGTQMLLKPGYLTLYIRRRTTFTKRLNFLKDLLERDLGFRKKYFIKEK